MSRVQSKGGHDDGRAGTAHVQLVQALASGTLAQLQPLLLACIDAERSALARLMRDGSPPADGPEDLANLNILAGEITAYERSWRARFSHPFRTWPVPVEATARDAFSLVSDDELQGQLIGQPAIEALERRHADVMDTIDKRLWSLAALMGGQARPDNPFSPRHIVQSFLDTFTPADCSPRLRGALLRQFERLAGGRLGETYAWCNRQLAEAGIALAGVGDYATLAATTVATQRMANPGKVQVWGADNALQPSEASWRMSRADGGGGGEAGRGAVLRQSVRRRREAMAGHLPGGGVRDLRQEEFLATLSLMQGGGTLRPAGDGGYAQAMRTGLLAVAASLGIDGESAVPSPDQEDALGLVGTLFDHLGTGHHLLEEANASLAALALPYLRLTLEEPLLFERQQPPAMQLLSRLVELWDGNSRASEHELRLHGLADAAARAVVEDYHGDATVFGRVLLELQESLEPLHRRASISERRAWQAIEGGERLDAARLAADRQLEMRLRGQPLLCAVAGFLQDQWRQSLAQAWLRTGPDSDRFAAAVELGEAIARLDADAVRGEGAAVAAALIGLQPRLHACYLGCGLDGQGADALIAQLVSELARPDAPRQVHGFTPMAKPASDGAAADGIAELAGLQPGRRLLQVEGGGAPRTLRLAWRSALTGAVLLVNRQGIRELLLRPLELAAMLSDGRLLLRPAADPVEAALQRMEAGGP